VALPYHWRQPGDPQRALDAIRYDPPTATYIRVGQATETVAAAEVAARRAADKELQDRVAAELERERSKEQERILHDPATGAYFRVTPQGLEPVSPEEAAGTTPMDLVAKGPAPDLPDRQPDPMRVDPGSALYEPGPTGHLQPVPDDGLPARSSAFLAQVEERRRQDGVPLTDVPHLPEEVYRRGPEHAL
jgi:hypothetical protein